MIPDTPNSCSLYLHGINSSSSLAELNNQNLQSTIEVVERALSELTLFHYIHFSSDYNLAFQDVESATREIASLTRSTLLDRSFAEFIYRLDLRCISPIRDKNCLISVLSDAPNYQLSVRLAQSALNVKNITSECINMSSLSCYWSAADGLIESLKLIQRPASHIKALFLKILRIQVALLLWSKDYLYRFSTLISLNSMSLIDPLLIGLFKYFSRSTVFLPHGVPMKSLTRNDLDFVFACSRDLRSWQKLFKSSEVIYSPPAEALVFTNHISNKPSRIPIVALCSQMTGSRIHRHSSLQSGFLGFINEYLDSRVSEFSLIIRLRSLDEYHQFFSTKLKQAVALCKSIRIEMATEKAFSLFSYDAVASFSSTANMVSMECGVPTFRLSDPSVEDSWPFSFGKTISSVHMLADELAYSVSQVSSSNSVARSRIRHLYLEKLKSFSVLVDAI